MKYLGIVSDPKDLTNKQYVDGKVGEVNTSLTTLSGRVDTAEDNIQMAESDIGDLQTETNTLKTDMTTVKGAVKTLQDTYVPNTTKVNGQALSGDVTIEAVQYTSQTLTASQKEQARTNIGAGTSNFSGSYNDLTNKPTTTIGLDALLASEWSSSGTYSFDSSYPYGFYDVTIEIDSSATDAQIEAWAEAKIVGSYNSNIFTAKGTIPKVDIPIILTVQTVRQGV